MPGALRRQRVRWACCRLARRQSDQTKHRATERGGKGRAMSSSARISGTVSSARKGSVPFFGSWRAQKPVSHVARARALLCVANGSSCAAAARFGGTQ